MIMIWEQNNVYYRLNCISRLCQLSRANQYYVVNLYTQNGAMYDYILYSKVEIFLNHLVTHLLLQGKMLYLTMFTSGFMYDAHACARVRVLE